MSSNGKNLQAFHGKLGTVGWDVLSEQLQFCPDSAEEVAPMVSRQAEGTARSEKPQAAKGRGEVEVSCVRSTGSSRDCYVGATRKLY